MSENNEVVKLLSQLSSKAHVKIQNILIGLPEMPERVEWWIEVKHFIYYRDFEIYFRGENLVPLLQSALQEIETYEYAMMDWEAYKPSKTKR